MRSSSAAALGAGGALSALGAWGLWFNGPLGSTYSIYSIAGGLAAFAVFGFTVAGRTGTMPCWFCTGRIGANEFKAEIAQEFPGPGGRFFPAHNECAERFVARYAGTDQWERLRLLRPEFFGADGHAPPARSETPAPPAPEGPATPGPSAPPAPAVGLTPEEEAILQVVRAARAPLNMTQTLTQAGISGSKRYLVYGLKNKGLLNVQTGKWPEPTLVSAVEGP